ncbi:hypothetical protein AtNW77_Chr1g0040901 [Arabidopsis thaliana]
MHLQNLKRKPNILQFFSYVDLLVLFLRKKIGKEVWEQTLLSEIKIGASGSNSGRDPSCNNSCKPNRH